MQFSLLTAGAAYCCSALVALTPITVSRVVDGDTIVTTMGEHLRLTAIDAPETWKPHCERELDLGMRASDRLNDLLRNANVTIRRDGTDRFHRTLATVYADGDDVSEVLFREGLVLRYQAGFPAKLARLHTWCGGNARIEDTIN